MWMCLRSVLLFFTTFAIVYGLLQIPTISSLYSIKNAALLVLAYHLADNFIQFIWNSLPSPTVSNLQDRAVLITGCDTGFGNKLARQLDAKNVTVFAGCLFANGPAAQKLKEDCSDKLKVLQLDVTKQEQVDAVLTSVKDTLKGKPLLSIVNNAGIFSMTELELLPIEELRKVLEVNTIGVARVTQAFLPLLRKSKGRVVIVASLVSKTSLPFLGGYTMSKFAVYAYALTLRMEMMRRSVTVHTIEPTIYQTEMANEDLAMAKINSIFNSSSEEIREAYGGESYLQVAKNAWNYGFCLKYPNNRIVDVTNCMEDAAIGKYPKVSYVPGTRGKFLTSLLIGLPRGLIDLIMSMTINCFHIGIKKKTV